MISYQNALDLVINNAVQLSETLRDMEDCLGFVLARDVFSDMDMPPFNKSAVDGYACRKSDISAELRCVDSIAAGQVPSRALEPGDCIQIMTGCIIPHGADCVLMVEHTEKLSNGNIHFLRADSAMNICFKAEDIKDGQKVLEAGTLLQPEHIAVLASVGCTRVLVYSKPTVGIISTGDELVEPSEKPGPAHIRNSNAAQLKAQLQKAGFSSRYYGIAPDIPEKTLEMISLSMNENHVTLLTGGVSMGKFDFVPAMMEKAGLNILFKSIAVQPGRPTLFGKTSTNQFCFGLPGNPVSSFVQLHLLVLPLLHLLSGHKYKPLSLRLPLAHDYQRKKTERMAVIPAKIDEHGSISQISYHGSAHIHAYVYANAFMIVNTDTKEIKKGELIDVRPI